jgi:hypothetical protein
MALLHSQHGHAAQSPKEIDELIDDDLFIDPMLGIPLAFYIEKDVADRDNLIHLITVSVQQPSTLSSSGCPEKWWGCLFSLQQRALHTWFVFQSCFVTGNLVQ